MQAPSTQDSPEGHAKPQSPQFDADDMRFTHLPLHRVLGLVHVVEPPQTPCEQ